MKNLKITLILLAISASILLLSCGSKNRKEGSVLGSWELKKTEGYDIGNTGKSILSFEENGNYLWKTGIIEVKGTYKVSNDTLFTHTEGEITDTKYNIKFKDGQLLMTLITDPKYQITFFFE